MEKSKLSYDSLFFVYNMEIFTKRISLNKYYNININKQIKYKLKNNRNNIYR